MIVSNIHRGVGAAVALFGLASADADAQTYAKMSDHRVVLKGDNGKAIFEGAGFNGPSGSPALPKYTLRFLLPAGTDAKTISVGIENQKQETISGAYDVAPVPPLVGKGGLTWPAGSMIQDGKDLAVYGRNAFYPSSHLGKVRTSKLGTFQVVEVEVNEYLYNPVTRQLRHVIDGDLVVKSNAVVAANAAMGAKSAYETRVEKNLKNLVDNYGTAIQSYPKTAAAVAAAAEPASTYLIVTTDAIYSGSAYLNSFANAKRDAGFNVEIVTPTKHLKRVGSLWNCVDQVDCAGGWGGGTGDVASERLRSWLQRNYIARNIEYALLIGNPDPTTGNVPMKRMWPLRNRSGSIAFPNDLPQDTLLCRQSPSDYYYADLTGDWDLDNDGFFGEEDDDDGNGGMDNLSEIAVGRIPYYGSITDLDKILAKTIRYQQEEDKSWRSRILVSQKAIVDDPSTGRYVRNYEMGEYIRNSVASPMGWGMSRIYDSAFGVNPDMHPTREDSVLKAWTAKDYGIHLWYTHGWLNSASGIFSSSNAWKLDDAHPSFTFQGSCLTAYPESSTNLAYSLLKNGAIATLGASRVSWASVPDNGQGRNNSSGSLGNLGAKFAEYMVRDRMSVGNALSELRATTGSGWWMNMQDFNVYGDPSLTLGDAPALLPTAPSIVSVVPGNQSIKVTWKKVAKATSYTVSFSTAASSMTALDVTDTTYTMTGLMNGTLYTVKVVAVNGEGSSAPSTSTATPNGLVPPPAPGSFAAVPGDAKVSLSWASAARATEYVVERATPTAQFSTLKVVTGLSYVDASVANGSKYYYRVSGRNSGGQGAVSTTLTATPSANSEPCSPATSVTNNTGNFNTTGKVCYKTVQNISGWGCSNFDGRTVKVNGVQVACGGALPAKTNGAYYFDVSAGAYSWASMYWW